MLIRRALTGLALSAAALVALATAMPDAHARPVTDDPSATVCHPGQTVVGATCLDPDDPADPADPTAGDPDGLGGWTSAGLGVLHLALFVLI